MTLTCDLDVWTQSWWKDIPNVTGISDLVFTNVDSFHWQSLHFCGRPQLYREYTREGSQILLKLVDVIMDGPQRRQGVYFPFNCFEPVSEWTTETVIHDQCDVKPQLPSQYQQHLVTAKLYCLMTDTSK